MSKLKITLIVMAAVILGVGAVAYGALTAPKQQAPVSSQAAPQKTDLVALLKTEQPTITGALVAAYPKIATDYSINQGELFGQGEWYGTTLTYKGSDSMNRDTLRVLMQKKEGVWILRTTPPEPLLSTKDFPDVPRSVLQTINKAISLPGSDTSPAVTVNG